jgi:endonuclease/exonuclease/phosphatase family metal-dependent hydrolase
VKGIGFTRKTADRTRRPAARLVGSHPPEARKNSLSDSIPNIGLNLAVMSFNIRRGTAQDGRNHWIHRRNLVREVLNQYRPDVLGLQEALDFQISEIRAMLPGYECIGIGSQGESKGLHNAIFYDAGLFVLSEEGTFWLSDTPDIPGSKGWGNIIPRICTWARLVDKESRQAFYFYNAHLDHISQRSRKKSVISLIQRINARPFSDPIVLAGDFNASEKSAPIRYLKGRIPLTIKRKVKVPNPTPLMDTFRVRYPGKRNTPTYHGFRRRFFRFKLDYIFVSSSVRVVDAEIIQLRRDRRYPSDHFPLLAHIGLPVDVVSSDSGSFTGHAINY